MWNFSCIYIINMLIYITHWINSKWKLLKTYSAYIFIKITLYLKLITFMHFRIHYQEIFFYIIFQEIIMILAALFALVVGIYMFLFWQLSWNEEPATLILSDGYSDIFVVWWHQILVIGTNIIFNEIQNIVKNSNISDLFFLIIFGLRNVQNFLSHYSLIN